MKVQQMTSTLAGLLQRHEQEAHTSINLAPSENVLSPLARLPFVLDMYGRYFFDDLPKHGIHKFFGGLQPGEIETQIVVPLLKRMTGATYVTVKPLSGLHCMTIALTALTKPGERVLSISPANGGHDCLSPLGARLGLHMESLPMSSPHDLDLLALEQVLTDDPPALVYIDQSTVLFPVDPRPIRNIVDKHSLPTRIHYDSSHLNGLILGQAVFNPLEQGAHTFGGSTHKTLPGPHKGFLATTDWLLARRSRR